MQARARDLSTIGQRALELSECGRCQKHKSLIPCRHKPVNIILNRKDAQIPSADTNKASDLRSGKDASPITDLGHSTEY